MVLVGGLCGRGAALNGDGAGAAVKAGGSISVEVEVGDGRGGALVCVVAGLACGNVGWIGAGGK